MIGITLGAKVGTPVISIVNGGTRTPADYARAATKRLISVSDGTHPAIRDQAHDFARRIEALIEATVKAAVDEERAWCAHLADKAGSRDAAAAIRGR